MNDVTSGLQDNFYQINMVIGLLFLFIYGFMLINLIRHMRTMVRLKYHVDKRAEFDESRVKIIIVSMFVLWLIYLLTWAYSLLALDIQKEQDYLLASSLFKAASVSLLVGAYAVFFINNRVVADINHIKSTVSNQEDASQKALYHL